MPMLDHPELFTKEVKTKEESCLSFVMTSNTIIIKKKPTTCVPIPATVNSHIYTRHGESHGPVRLRWCKNLAPNRLITRMMHIVATNIYEMINQISCYSILQFSWTNQVCVPSLHGVGRDCNDDIGLDLNSYAYGTHDSSHPDICIREKANKP